MFLFYCRGSLLDCDDDDSDGLPDTEGDLVVTDVERRTNGEEGEEGRWLPTICCCCNWLWIQFTKRVERVSGSRQTEPVNQSVN